jgi:alginate O-acetyltransferase complex protein AlgI
MLFNSIEFLFFFPIVIALFFMLPHKFRWSLLLVASCYFYMFFRPVYILILFFTIVIDYYAGILIEKQTDQKKRRWWLIMSLVANIGVLAIFKYFNFINANITGLGELLGVHVELPYLAILLPVGLSFHTFQAMSYTIEIYRGNYTAEKHFGIYALYVMFFPQLVAGPIERPQNMLPQFHEKKTFTYENAVNGLNLIAWGMFKKVVIADRLAEYVNLVYGNANHYTTIPVVIATVFFVFQIYCDFSGYSDIAIGLGKMMGYELMENFDRPLISKSVSEFWRRWHISLSSWFRDYLFSPIIFSHKNWGAFALIYAAFVTFILCGLWHGAKWNFIIFGTLQGALISYEIVTTDFRKKLGKKMNRTLHQSICLILTFCFTCFSMIFFRADTFQQAKTIVKKIFQFNLHFSQPEITTKLGSLNFMMSLLVIAMLIFAYYLPKNMEVRFKTAFFISITALTIILGTNGKAEFIYFQF